MVMNRVVVVVPNWYGETLFATPFLRALRQQCPTAFIATLGWPSCREVLLHNPAVNECLDYDERGAHRSLAGKWRVMRALQARRFDTAFLLRKSLSRSLLLLFAGIPVRVGFANAKSGWALTHRVAPSRAPRHKASTYLPLLEAVGLSIVPGPYEYVVSDAERQQIRQQLAAAPPGGRPLIILHPGANWAHKRWAPERFAALGDRLSMTQRARVVITGGPDDAALAESIARRMQQPAAVLANRTTLRQLAAYLEQASLVVSNDTGVAHLAAALCRPLVALYGPTSPQLTGPLGDPQRTMVLHHSGCCPQIPCYSPDRPPHAGMNAISVEEAYSACVQMLQFGMRNSECGIQQTP